MKNYGFILGGIIGLITGYPLSYFFQSGALRAKLSMGDYIQHFGDVTQSKDLMPTVAVTWIGAVVAFALLGLLIGNVRKKKE